jgi:hypothetical protein
MSGRRPEPATFNLEPSTTYALRRDLGFWRLTFEGREAILKHETGLAYVAWLLTHPSEEPIHGLRLALEVRGLCGNGADAADLIQQRNLGLDEAEAFRSLRRKQKRIEAQLEDDLISESVKSELREELEAICEHQARNPWRARDATQKCVHAVSMAIKRLHHKLARAVNTEGKPHPVLRPFGQHVLNYILIPSGRGGIQGGGPVGAFVPGCFTYEPPTAVTWTF